MNVRVVKSLNRVGNLLKMIVPQHGFSKSHIVWGCVLWLGITAASPLHAGLTTFTFSGPAIQGTLDGVPFEAPFTITAQADPDSMVFGTIEIEGTPFPTGLLPATSTITIDGFATVTFSDSLFGPFQTDLGSLSPGLLAAGFGVPDNSGSIQGFFAIGIPTGDSLVDVGFSVSQQFSFATTGGVLIIESNTVANCSYGPIVSSPVPEPSTWAMSLIAVGMTAVGALRRRLPTGD